MSDTYNPTTGIGSGGVSERTDFGTVSFDPAAGSTGSGSAFDWSSFATAAVTGATQIAGGIVKAVTQPGAAPAGTSGSGLQTGGVSVRKDFPQITLEIPAEPAAVSNPAPAQVATIPVPSNTGLYVGIGLGVAALLGITVAVVASSNSKKRRGS